MTKTEFLQIRLTPEDRTRVNRVAAAEHLEPSTWARQAILRAVAEAELAAQVSSQAHKEPVR